MPEILTDHGHGKPVLGCKQCIELSRNGWVCCFCDALNAPWRKECRTCQVELRVGFTVCLCGHRRRNHDKGNNECSAKYCGCSKFDTKSGRHWVGGA